MKVSDYIIDIKNIASREWDVILVGSGMGGGTAAYALANGGLKVLLIEKGISEFITTNHSDGIEIEQENPADRLQNGKWPHRLTSSIDGVLSDF